MDLEIQIQSITTSFVYGMFSSLVYNIIYFLLYSKSKIIMIMFNFFYTIVIFLLFFYIMLCINNGIIHIYFIFLLILGFIFGNIKLRKIRINIKSNNKRYMKKE